MPPRRLHKAEVNDGYPMVTTPIYPVCTVPCCVWQSGSLLCVATVCTPRWPHETLELHGLTGAGVFVAAGATVLLKGVGHHFLLV